MITLSVETNSLARTLSKVQQVQLPFAASKALNAVALDIQTAERQRIDGLFTVRRKLWVDRSVKITHFATKAEPFVRIAISPPGAPQKADILGKFEDQTSKQAKGAHGIALPVDARRSKGDIIRADQRPKAFDLHQQGGAIVGNQGTYIVKLPDGRQLLLQRRTLGTRAAKKAGRSSSDRATLLYIFTPKPVTLRTPLQFAPTAKQVVDRLWQQRFSEALTYALATAR